MNPELSLKPDIQYLLEVFKEEGKRLNPNLQFEKPETRQMPEGFDQFMAPSMPAPVEEVPTIEQEPQVQPVSPVPPPPTPQNRPQPRSADPIGGLQSPSAGRDERADALFE